MAILAVDDSKIIRKIIRGAVEVLECEYLEANSGEEALSVLRSSADSIELVLLDLNMPGMHGFEVLEVMKKDDRWKDIPVMIVTTESEKESIIQAVKMGAAHYLVKPFTMEELIKNIMECFGKGESI